MWEGCPIYAVFNLKMIRNPYMGRKRLNVIYSYHFLLNLFHSVNILHVIINIMQDSHNRKRYAVNQSIDLFSYKILIN
jgi:hypothetical protein